MRTNQYPLSVTQGNQVITLPFGARSLTVLPRVNDLLLVVLENEVNSTENYIFYVSPAEALLPQNVGTYVGTAVLFGKAWSVFEGDRFVFVEGLTC